MDQNENNKVEFKDKLFKFYNSHKLKIYLFSCIIIIAIITVFVLKISKEKENTITAEKYIKAGLLLSSGKNVKSKNLYNEIILRKNKFYSILSLNTILEKNLEIDKTKILNYFEIIEGIKMPPENKDIVIFKKALYLIKISEAEAGTELLKNLIDRESQLKDLAKEIINK